MPNHEAPGVYIEETGGRPRAIAQDHAFQTAAGYDLFHALHITIQIARVPHPGINGACDFGLLGRDLLRSAGTHGNQAPVAPAPHGRDDVRRSHRVQIDETDFLRVVGNAGTDEGHHDFLASHRGRKGLYVIDVAFDRREARAPDGDSLRAAGKGGHSAALGQRLLKQLRR